MNRDFRFAGAIVAGLLMLAAATRSDAQQSCPRKLGPEMTPQAALDSLTVGNLRFVAGRMLPRAMPCSRDSTKKDQMPFAVVLGCMDSRTAPEYLFDRGIGELFSLRVAGNVLNNDILGSMEYATVAINAKVIAVVGHTDCGAIKGACNHDYSLDFLTDLLVKIEPAVQAIDSTVGPHVGDNPRFVDQVTKANVLYVMNQIPKRSQSIKALLDAGRVKLVGGIHNVETGAVQFMWQYKPTGK